MYRRFLLLAFLLLSALRMVMATEKPGDGLTLIETLQLAGRQKHAGAALNYLRLSEKLITTSDPAAVDSRGRTALHWCVLSAQSASSQKLGEAYWRLVAELLNAGTDVNALDVFGNSPLDYQQNPGTAEIEQVLIEQGGQHGYSHSAVARTLRLLEQVRLAAEQSDGSRVRALLDYDLPANSTLSIRLLTRLASHSSRAGDPVDVVVTAALEVDGRRIVPAGTKIEGTVLHAHRASNKFEQAQLEIDFCNLVHESGGRMPIAALLTEVDNAREQVHDGRIVGISFPHTFAERLSEAIRMVGLAHPLLAHALEVASMSWQKEFHREIVLDPGVDMTLKILAPEKLAGLPNGSSPAVGIPPDLARIIQDFPLRTVTPKGVPSDLVNILFIASQSQLAGVFEAAGWVSAQKLGLKSGLKTFSSLAAQKGYSEAPVSLLLLDGKQPDLVYQKQTNTFTKRHHIRIWRCSQSYQGRELWLGAATHDIGISVLKGGTHWIHRIDPQIDREQTKVKDDLSFTRSMEWFSLAERPGAPQRATNATGDEIRTQGKLLVLKFAP